MSIRIAWFLQFIFLVLPIVGYAEENYHHIKLNLYKQGEQLFVRHPNLLQHPNLERSDYYFTREVEVVDNLDVDEVERASLSTV